MPKIQPNPFERKKNEVSVIAVVISAIVLTAALTSAVIIFTPDKLVPPQELEQQPAKLLDFTGQLFYGRDKSTGMCFAARFSSAKRGFAHVPCEALERLK